MSSPALELRPLALGEIIDRSAIFWRRNLKTLFLLAFGFDLLGYILTKGMQLVALQTQRTLLASSGSEEEAVAALGAAGQMMLALGVTMVLALWLYQVVNVVVARYVVPSLLGDKAEPADGYRRAWQKLGALTGAYVLSLLWAMAMSFLLSLPGVLLAAGGGALSFLASGGSRVLGSILLGLGLILMLLGVTGAMLWYLLRFSLLAPTLAMEDLGAVGAFRRCGSLLSGRVEPGFGGLVTVRAMILVTVVTAIVLTVGLTSGLPVLLARYAYGNLSMDARVVVANPVPQAVLVPLELLQVSCQALFSPLALVFYATFYLDLRVRREGLDLERRLEDLPARQAGAA